MIAKAVAVFGYQDCWRLHSCSWAWREAVEAGIPAVAVDNACLSPASSFLSRLDCLEEIAAEGNADTADQIRGKDLNALPAGLKVLTD